MKFTATILVLSLVLATSPSFAKLRLITLEDMIRGADMMVLGELEQDSPMHAVIKVKRTLKGTSTEEIEFDLTKRSGCQVPIAKAPEEVALFITVNEDGTHRIYATGRGCMPIDVVDGKKYAAFHSMVSVHHTIERMSCVKQRSGYKQSIPLVDLLDYVEKIKAKGRVKKKLKVPDQQLDVSVKTPIESGQAQGMEVSPLTFGMTENVNYMNLTKKRNSTNDELLLKDNGCAAGARHGWLCDNGNE